jgi:hypothetical protein
MNRWNVVGWGLLIASAPALALDHNLIGTARLAATKTARPQAMLDDAALASRSRYPVLREGDCWICAVGQTDDIGAKVRKHARALGWGFWRFPAHAKCPAGIYACVVREGRLRVSGNWTECTQPIAAPEHRID